MKMVGLEGFVLYQALTNCAHGTDDRGIGRPATFGPAFPRQLLRYAGWPRGRGCLAVEAGHARDQGPASALGRAFRKAPCSRPGSGGLAPNSMLQLCVSY